ncbi:MAG: EF-P lysine aminoacylase EpmA [Candidatus Pacebacteria bacterium]|nr:EF-P lysine aminoacylase EpmA [Candidatus Paceibacterota bacterium]
MKNWKKIKQNPDLKEQFLIREKVIDGIRDFFKSNDFHEVETPMMVKYPGTEPFLEVFETELKWANGKRQQAFMLTSPEFAMKKLLVAGFENIFQVCKSFRNGEGISSRHNPEFTILEWYRSNASYEEIMQDCQDLMLSLSKRVNGSDILEYQGKKYDLSKDWVKISVAEAFEKWVGVDIDGLLDRNKMIERAKQEGYQVDDKTTWEEVYNQLFLNLIESQLVNYDVPVILYDYPASQAAYSKKKQSDPRFAQRFEFYLGGYELGNAFSEENDPKVQEEKFREDLQLRKELGKTDYGMDEDYLDALKEGLPPSGGIAVGVDRLVMLFANTKSIQETMFFPAQEVFE